MNLKSSLGVIEDHWKWYHSIDRIQVPVRLPLYNYGRILYRFRTKRDNGQKRQYFIPPLYLTCRIS